MIDIFKLFRVDTKEDVYTYCLEEMIEHGGADFRKKVGSEFGFEDDFKVVRRAFPLPDEGNGVQRHQIIPDLVLYNTRQVSVIESKMFSWEGSTQTEDYQKGEAVIKKELDVEAANVSYYYLTLSGISAENKVFIAKEWADFYEKILSNVSFQDEALEVIRKTILAQVEKYKGFIAAMESEPYQNLFNEEYYWITPMTLFASGVYDKDWQNIAGEEKFEVWNGEVNGRGHAEFTTNLYKRSWEKCGVGEYDNVRLFIRIEWGKTPVVWLCWEYFRKSTGGYIPTSKIEPAEYRTQAIDFLRQYKESWNQKEIQDLLPIQSTGRKASSIKALKCSINGDKSISETVEKIKKVVLYYSKEIQKIIQAFSVTDRYLTFSAKQYHLQEKKESDEENSCVS